MHKAHRGKKKAITLALKARNSLAEQMGCINLAKMRAWGIRVCVWHARKSKTSVCVTKNLLYFVNCPFSYPFRIKVVAGIIRQSSPEQHVPVYGVSYETPTTKWLCFSTIKLFPFRISLFPAMLWTLSISQSEPGHIDTDSDGNFDDLMLLQCFLSVFLYVKFCVVLSLRVSKSY